MNGLLSNHWFQWKRVAHWLGFVETQDIIYIYINPQTYNANCEQYIVSFSHDQAHSKYGPQGTWQFMSANLMSQPDVLHDFRDDLESSLYTLLWTTVMYSEVSDRDLVQWCRHFWPAFLIPSLIMRRAAEERRISWRGSHFCKMSIFRIALRFRCSSVIWLDCFRSVTWKSPPERIGKHTTG